jgi:CDP-diacylglycerol--glycerol-3-phosphate 3-phosphatidyltransferase
VSYELVVLWLHLGKNHRAGEEEVLPGLGWGNYLSLLRSCFIAGLMGFLFSPWPTGWLAWLPTIFYGLAVTVDFFDGYVARLTNHVTLLGETLDMSFDSVGMLAAALLAAQYGQVPAWYILIALARYLFLAGLWLRKQYGKPIFELPKSNRRRFLAGMQMGFTAVILWPILSPPGTWIAATLFGSSLLFSFAIDWLYISGLIKPGSIRTPAIQKQFQEVSALALRLGQFGLALALCLSGMVENYPNPMPITILNWLIMVVSVLVLLGIAARTGSWIGLVLLGLSQIYASLTAIQIALGISFFLIGLLGSGPYSLWAPEDNLIFRRAGERKKPRREVSKHEALV